MAGRPRRIDPLAAARFVQGYDGEHGRPFREAMAARFGVSARTVKRALPRLVREGWLVPRAIAGRGSPLAYDNAPLAEGWRRGGFSAAARRPTIDDHGEWFRRAWDLGAAGWCPRCGATGFVTAPWAPEFDPVCGSGCRYLDRSLPEQAWDYSTGRPRLVETGRMGVWRPLPMETAHTMGLLGRPEPPPEPPPRAAPEPDQAAVAALWAEISGAADGRTDGPLGD